MVTGTANTKDGAETRGRGAQKSKKDRGADHLPAHYTHPRALREGFRPLLGAIVRGPLRSGGLLTLPRLPPPPPGVLPRRGVPGPGGPLLGGATSSRRLSTSSLRGLRESFRAADMLPARCKAAIGHAVGASWPAGGRTTSHPTAAPSAASSFGTSHTGV